jgi:hypothetical protein
MEKELNTEILELRSSDCLGLSRYWLWKRRRGARLGKRGCVFRFPTTTATAKFLLCSDHGQVPRQRGSDGVTNISSFGVEADQQFVSQGDADDLGRFARCSETLLEEDEVGFAAARDAGHDEKDLAHRGASSADPAFALVFSAVAGQRSHTGQFRDGLIGPARRSRASRRTGGRRCVRQRP